MHCSKCLEVANHEVVSCKSGTQEAYLSRGSCERHLNEVLREVTDAVVAAEKAAGNAFFPAITKLGISSPVVRKL